MAFLPMGMIATSWPFSLASMSALRIRRNTCVLKAPARPRLLTIGTKSTFFTGRCVLYLPSLLSSEALTLLRMFCNFSAYGRMRTMASWARRSLAALTIFMAAVICLVLFTETILLRTSFRLGIALQLASCELASLLVGPAGQLRTCRLPLLNYQGSSPDPQPRAPAYR